MISTLYRNVSGHELVLRPLKRTDRVRWQTIRLTQRHYLEPVEPTVPTTWEDAHSNRAWRFLFTNLRREAENSQSFPFALEVDGDFAGQVTISGIQWGISRCGSLGYWIDQCFSGQGITSAAVDMVCEYAFAQGLHRIEATALPENKASIRVLRKNGFIQEGLLHKKLNIAGRWQDHFLFGLLREDYLYNQSISSSG